MRAPNLFRIIHKSILTSVAASLSLTVYSYAAGPAAVSSTISLLESVRQSYYANERLESLKNNNSINAIKEVPAEMWLKKVNSDEVNMVTNRYAGKQQSAIVIDGRTYYATGEGYAINLSGNQTVRFSRDPVTNEIIDKAGAVTYADASGRILYFESETTFESFIEMANSEDLYGYSNYEFDRY